MYSLQHLVANRVLVDFEQPLHHAARGEHVNVIRLLLASGACPTKTNIYGKVSALMQHFFFDLTCVVAKFLMSDQFNVMSDYCRAPVSLLHLTPNPKES